jgi:hypothetical protein
LKAGSKKFSWKVNIDGLTTIFSGFDIVGDDMKKEDILKFIVSSEEFCALVETASKLSKEELIKKIHFGLSSLYLAALLLSDSEPSSNDIPEINIDTSWWEGLEDVDFYWEVFDPFQNDEPLCGSLTDDIRDIYKDIKSGLAILENMQLDDIKNAIWFWKFSFSNHWGYHAVNALRALHWAING